MGSNMRKSIIYWLQKTYIYVCIKRVEAVVQSHIIQRHLIVAISRLDVSEPLTRTIGSQREKKNQ